MNFARALRQCGIVAWYELVRLCGGTKSRIILAILPVVTVLPVALGRIGGVRRRQFALEDARAIAAGVARVYNPGVAQHLFGCPTVLVWLTDFTLFATPAVTLALAYDSIVLERNGQSLVMMAVRAPLASVVVGKCAAVSLAFCSMVGVTHAIVWAVDGGRHRDSWEAVISWGPWMLAVCCIVAVTHVALWIFVSTLSRSSKVVMAAGAVFLLVFGSLHNVFHQRMPGWDGLTPMSMDQGFLSGILALRVRAFEVAVCWCAACLAAGAGVMRVRDL